MTPATTAQDPAAHRSNAPSHLLAPEAARAVFPARSRRGRVAGGALAAALVILAAVPAARADDGWTDSLVATVSPASARVRAEVGWSTTADASVADLRTEVRVWDRLSLVGGIHARGDAPARPVVGAAYQLHVDDARSLRAQVVYRPEGMVEPEGELEASLTGARRLGGGWLAGAVTYGQDPEGRERDAEGVLEYRARVGGAAAGPFARGRRALGTRLEDDRVWDGLAGAVASVGRGRWSVDTIAAVEHVARRDDARTGLFTTVAVGAAW